MSSSFQCINFLELPIWWYLYDQFYLCLMRADCIPTLGYPTKIMSRASCQRRAFAKEFKTALALNVKPPHSSDPKLQLLPKIWTICRKFMGSPWFCWIFPCDLLMCDSWEVTLEFQKCNQLVGRSWLLVRWGPKNGRTAVSFMSGEVYIRCTDSTWLGNNFDMKWY